MGLLAVKFYLSLRMLRNSYNGEPIHLEGNYIYTINTCNAGWLGVLVEIDSPYLHHVVFVSHHA